MERPLDEEAVTALGRPRAEVYRAEVRKHSSPQAADAGPGQAAGELLPGKVGVHLHPDSVLVGRAPAAQVVQHALPRGTRSRGPRRLHRTPSDARPIPVTARAFRYCADTVRAAGASTATPTRISCLVPRSSAAAAGAGTVPPPGGGSAASTDPQQPIRCRTARSSPGGHRPRRPGSAVDADEAPVRVDSATAGGRPTASSACSTPLGRAAGAASAACGVRSVRARK